MITISIWIPLLIISELRAFEHLSKEIIIVQSHFCNFDLTEVLIDEKLNKESNEYLQSSIPSLF